MGVLEWSTLTEESLPDLVLLASSCLRRDGGVPSLSDPETLRRLFLTGQGIGARDELGDLVGAVGFAFDEQGHRTATGMVHPSFLGQGMGLRMAEWVIDQAGGAPVNIALESVSPSAEEFLGDTGYRRARAERIMCHDQPHVPIVRRPAGLTLLPYSDDTAPAFHSVHAVAFADEPGFTVQTSEQWNARVRAEPGFLPLDSRVAFDETGRAVGFVTVSECWIDQVGVIPEWRGRRLGAHLVVRSVTALRKTGCERVWLAVAVGNPARELYERLGFTVYGTRARYEPREPGLVLERLTGLSAERS